MLGVSVVTVTADDDSHTIFYAADIARLGPGLYRYDPANDKHTVINSSKTYCLASSSDGSQPFAVRDRYLYSVDPNTGSFRKISDLRFPESIEIQSQCAMNSDGIFYFLNEDGIWFMDTPEDGDKK